jgi:UDP-N-acetylglucosamine acyltransferase
VDTRTLAMKNYRYGSSNIIHPTATVDDEVKMGNNNYIGPYCYLTGYLSVGDNNRFEGHCSVGTRPEHKDFWHEDGPTVIGDNNVFREHITIHSGSNTDLTYVGNNVIMLRGSHVAHDCVIEDDVTLSCVAHALGHVYVMEGSNLGSGCHVHQHQVIGSWSMIGMGAIVTKKARVVPGRVWVGNPAKDIKSNDYKMKDIHQVFLEKETMRYSELIEERGL